MGEEREHATYGSTRCTTFGCSKEQVKKCHEAIRINRKINKPTNSPIAIIKRNDQMVDRVKNRIIEKMKIKGALEGAISMEQNLLTTRLLLHNFNVRF